MTETMSSVNKTALADLIDSTLIHNGWSDRDACRRAEAMRFKLTPSDITTWRREGMPRKLSPEKVKALAAGLGLPPYVVAVRVLQDFGITVPEDTTSPEEAVRRDHTLSERTREQLLLLIQHDRDRT